jgi:hypothetical protein
MLIRTGPAYFLSSIGKASTDAVLATCPRAYPQGHARQTGTTLYFGREPHED